MFFWPLLFLALTGKSYGSCSGFGGLNSDRAKLILSGLPQNLQKAILSGNKVLAEDLVRCMPKETCLLYATLTRQPEMMRDILSDVAVDASIGDNFAFFVACKKGYADIVRAVLRHCEVDLAAHDNEALKVACQKGHVEVVRVLLGSVNVNAAVSDNLPLRVSSQDGHVEIVMLLLAVSTTDFRVAFESGNEAVLEFLEGKTPASLFRACEASDLEAIMQHDFSQMTSGHFDMLIDRYELGDVRVLMQLVLLQFQFTGTVSSKASSCYQRACLNGTLAGIAAFGNFVDQRDRELGFLCACQAGNLELAQYFVDGGMVVPSVDNNEAIRRATLFQRTAVVEYLLQAEGVSGDDCLTIACTNGYLDVAQALLQHPSVDPTRQDNDALIKASCHGHLDLVRLLLEKNHQIDPSAQCCQALKLALDNNFTQIVLLLLKHPSMAAAKGLDHVLKAACRAGHSGIVRRLLSCHSTNFNVAYKERCIPQVRRLLWNIPFALFRACCRGDLGAVEKRLDRLYKLSLGQIEMLLLRSRRFPLLVAVLHHVRMAKMGITGEELGDVGFASFVARKQHLPNSHFFESLEAYERMEAVVGVMGFAKIPLDLLTTILMYAGFSKADAQDFVPTRYELARFIDAAAKDQAQ